MEFGPPVRESSALNDERGTDTGQSVQPVRNGRSLFR